MSPETRSVRILAMVRRIVLLVAFALGVSHFIAPAYGQDGGPPQYRGLPSLSERLEQFRVDLLGESPSQTQSRLRRGSPPDEIFSADRKALGGGRPAKENPSPKLAE